MMFEESRYHQEVIAFVDGDWVFEVGAFVLIEDFFDQLKGLNHFEDLLLRLTV